MFRPYGNYVYTYTKTNMMRITLALTLAIITHGSKLPMELSDTLCKQHGNVWNVCRDSNQCIGGQCTEEALPVGALCPVPRAECPPDAPCVDGVCGNVPGPHFMQLKRNVRAGGVCGFDDDTKTYSACATNLVCNPETKRCDILRREVGLGSMCGTILVGLLEHTCADPFVCIDSMCRLDNKQKRGEQCEAFYKPCELDHICREGVCEYRVSENYKVLVPVFITLASATTLMSIYVVSKNIANGYYTHQRVKGPDNF